MLELYMKNKTDAFAPTWSWTTMKKNKDDINESNIIDDWYFSDSHFFVHDYLVYDRRSCWKCGIITAGE